MHERGFEIKKGFIHLFEALCQATEIFIFRSNKLVKKYFSLNVILILFQETKQAGIRPLLVRRKAAFRWNAFLRNKIVDAAYDRPDAFVMDGCARQDDPEISFDLPGL